MSEQNKCTNMVNAAVKHGIELGLTAIEVHIEHTVQRTVTWESKAVLSAVSLPSKESQQADIRVYSSIGQVGLARGSASTQAAVHRLIDKAIESAKSAPANPHAGPAERYEQSEVGLGLMDRRFETLDDEMREDAVNDNLEDVRSVNGVDPELFRYTETVLQRAYASSNNVRRQEKGTRYRIEGAVALSDGSQRISGSVESRLFADVASLPLGADLANQLVRYRNPQPAPEGERPIMIEPKVVAAVMAAVVPAFDRASVDAGASFIAEGRRVGSDKLHMIDDGLVPGALNTRSFDVRGVPSLDIPLIREGAVGALYQAVELARELDGRPSGHEGRGSVWSGNLVLRAGTRSRNMISPDLGRFLVLDSLIDDGKNWYNLKTGKLTLTGHFFSAISGSAPVYIGIHTIKTTFVDLWSGIREVANDQRRYGSVDVSTWVVEGLSVA